MQCPNLSITKTADAVTVDAGNTIGFTITLSNSSAAGTGTATGATINDPLPGGSGVSWSIQSLGEFLGDKIPAGEPREGSPASAGMDPWVVGLIALMACNGFFLPYQSTTYLALYHGTNGRLFTHRQARPMAFAYGVFTLLALCASVPIWQAMGLL